MPYCAQADITSLELTEQDLVTLTDDRKVGKVDSTKVTAAIERADTEIDSYCRPRYTVPFNPVPAEIKHLSATIAAYWLCRRRRGVVDNSILDKYTKALSRLKAISEGIYAIEGATTLTGGGGVASTIDSSAVQTFTRSKYDKDGALVGDPGSTDTW